MDNMKDGFKDVILNIKQFIFGNTTDFYPRNGKKKDDYFKNKYKK